MLTSTSRFVNEIPEELLSSSIPRVRLFNDKKIYQMTLEIESNNSTNQIELQQKVNILINNRNDKVDIFKNCPFSQ